MLQLLTAIAGIIITILLVVGIHEFGHFIVARLVGVKVLRFSIGFGKSLFSWHDKSGTEYVLAAIPLGGYVKMLDEHEEPVPTAQLPYAFNRQPFWKKFAIVIAGPLFNLIFAFVIYWLLFMIGFISVIPMIGKITPHSIAADAGMKPQQEIVSINDKPTRNWSSIIINLLTELGDKKNLQISTENSDKKISSYELNLSHWKINDLRPDPLESLGIEPYSPTVTAMVGKVLPKSPAATTLKPGDVILAVNNIVVDDWNGLMVMVDKNPEKVLTFKIKRHGIISDIRIKTTYTYDLFFKKHGSLGIIAQFEWPKKLLRENKYGPIAAATHAWNDTKDFCNLNYIILKKLVTGKISVSSLGGPITIFQSAGTALNHGIMPFLNFLAFLSISIGLINVLPVPGLDGGHVLIQTIELIMRRPLPSRVLLLFYRLGFILILLLITQALINDIQRL